MEDHFLNLGGAALLTQHGVRVYGGGVFCIFFLALLYEVEPKLDKELKFLALKDPLGTRTHTIHIDWSCQ